MIELAEEAYNQNEFHLKPVKKRVKMLPYLASQMGVRKLLGLRKNIVHTDDDIGSLGIFGGESMEFFEYVD